MATAHGAESVVSPAFVALVQASSGAAAGVFASFVLQPVEVTKTQISISTSGDASALGTFREIASNDGLSGLFRGWVAKCTETGSKNFVYFYIYDWLNAAAKARYPLTTGVKLLLGYTAGVGNTLATMPLEVLATKAQLPSFKGLNLASVLLRILNIEGIGALYTGLGYNVILCINPAIQNTTFDRLKEMLLKYLARGAAKEIVSMSPMQAFALGAFAKAIATLVTYPLVRLKTILQAGSLASKPALRKSNSVELLKSISVRDDDKSEPSVLSRIAELYRGVGSALLKSTLQAALLYMMKDQIESTVARAFKLTAKVFFRRTGRLKVGALSGRPLAS